MNLYSPALSGPTKIGAFDLPGITFSMRRSALSNSSGDGVPVLDHELHLLPRGDLDPGGIEAMALDREDDVIGGVGAEGGDGEGEGKRAHRRFRKQESKR